MNNLKLTLIAQLHGVVVEYELAGQRDLAQEVRKLIDHKVSELTEAEYIAYCNQ